MKRLLISRTDSASTVPHSKSSRVIIFHKFVTLDDDTDVVCLSEIWNGRSSNPSLPGGKGLSSEASFIRCWRQPENRRAGNGRRECKSFSPENWWGAWPPGCNRWRVVRALIRGKIIPGFTNFLTLLNRWLERVAVRALSIAEKYWSVFAIVKPRGVTSVKIEPIFQFTMHYFARSCTS